MANAENEEQVRLTLDAGAEIDGGSLETLSGHLRERILELDVTAAAPVRSMPTEQGLKAGDVLSLSSMIVTLASAVLPELIRLLSEWVRHRKHVSITLERDGKKLVISGSSPGDLESLVASFVKG